MSENDTLACHLVTIKGGITVSPHILTLFLHSVFTELVYTLWNNSVGTCLISGVSECDTGNVIL